MLALVQQYNIAGASICAVLLAFPCGLKMVGTHTLHSIFKEGGMAQTPSVHLSWKSNSLTLSCLWPELGCIATLGSREAEKTGGQVGVRLASPW